MDQKGKGNPPQTKSIVDEKPYTKKRKDDNTWHPYMCGSTMNRYSNTWLFDGTYIKYGEWLAEPRYIPGEKIIIRQTADSLIATIDNEGVNNNTLHSITSKNNTNVSLKYLLGLLNSVILNWYFKRENFLEDGKTLAEVKGAHVKLLPIAIGNTDQIRTVEKKVSSMLGLCKERVDVRYRIIHYIVTRYVPKAVSNRLYYLEESSYDVWIRELKKQGSKVSVKEEIDLLELYEETVKKIVDLNHRIETTGNQLNSEIFSIYGLSNEAIKRIESETSIKY